MTQHFKSTMLHVLELVVILIVVYSVNQVFIIDSTLINGVVIAVLSGLTKFARTHEGSPIKDYVNS